MNTRVLLFVASALCTGPAHAALNVFACEPEWAALATELGGDRVQAYSATTANQDPHRIEPRPSLIAKLRRADLMICTGAELEAGWAPMLLRQAANPRVRPGQPGHFEAAAQVQRLDVPARVDRAAGDVHASGNPHVHTDPRRIATIAARLAERLAQIDVANAAHYRARHADFAQRWTQAIGAWEARAVPLRGARIVAQHKDWIYLFDWLGLVAAGTLEPKPGVPPGTVHLAALKSELARAPARALVRTPYQDPRPSEWLAQQTGIPQVMLPYTIGGSERATDLFRLFDDTLDRLLTVPR